MVDQSAHTCGRGNEGCINGNNHLVWKTPSGNMADKLIHGTHNRGNRHHKVKLDKEKVFAIRTLRGKHTQRELAAMFGVCVSNICGIQSGKTWGWLRSPQVE